MKFSMFVLCSAAMLIGANTALANDIYVAQSATGANSGADCADAYAYTFFNTSGNWGSGATKIGPGTTVHLCGTITSELSVQGSGTSSSVIEILFETGASIQISPGCDIHGCLNLGSFNYLLIDGGLNQPCGWNTATNLSEGTCNGKIENMLYGSSDATCPGGKCTTQAGSSLGNLILGSGGSNIEIRNLELGPSYVHTTTGNSGNDVGGTQCVLLQNGNNWNLHDNKGHDGSWCMVLSYGYGASSNWTIARNELYNNSHMTAITGSGTATLTTFALTGNYTHDMANWDTSSDANHANGIHSFGTSTTKATGFTINNNIFGGHMGQDATAQVFLEAQNSTLNGLQLFNNLMYNADTTSTASERLLFINVCMSACEVFNNTLVGPNNTWGWCAYIGANGTTNTPIDHFENNIMSNCYTLIEATTATFGTLDYNTYGLGGSWLWGSTFINFTQWKTDSGEGSHTTDNPGGISLGANYIPLPSSPAATTGVNLTTFGIPALNSDLAGQPRPTSGSWSTGAYQSQSVVTVLPPTSLTAATE